MGFTDHALILLSEMDSYRNGSSTYKYDYQTAVKNLIQQLTRMGIQHHCLISDSLATYLDMLKPTWLATGAAEDVFFMQHWCGVPTLECTPLEESLRAKLIKKYPIPRGIGLKERFPIVAQRVKLAERELIKSHRFVIVFGKQFHVTSQQGDGRAVMRVNSKTFCSTLELGGEPVPVDHFMQIPYGNLSLVQWGVYSGSNNR